MHPEDDVRVYTYIHIRAPSYLVAVSKKIDGSLSVDFLSKLGWWPARIRAGIFLKGKIIVCSEILSHRFRTN